MDSCFCPFVNQIDDFFFLQHITAKNFFQHTRWAKLLFFQPKAVPDYFFKKSSSPSQIMKGSLPNVCVWISNILSGVQCLCSDRPRVVPLLTVLRPRVVLHLIALRPRVVHHLMVLRPRVVPSSPYSAQTQGGPSPYSADPGWSLSLQCSDPGWFFTLQCWDPGWSITLWCSDPE